MLRKRNQDLIDKLIADRNHLLGKIEGLDSAIALLRADAGLSTAPERGSAKTLLIDLLNEAQFEGLNANIAEEMAKKRGKTLKRGTAGSNLSRMKAEGIVTYDGDKYRLPQFTRQAALAVVAGKGS